MKEITPTEEYVANSNTPSVYLPVSSKKHQLLILDLNGTLISRVHTLHDFYARPHHEAFFKFIFEHFHVMVWSSAQERSVNSMCRVFEEYQPLLRLVWDRNQFDLEPAEFYSRTSTRKNLEKVWSALPEFNAKNTAIIDDSEFKLVHQPYNLIHLSTFRHNNDQFDHDLLKVINYLLIIKQQSNIASFMKLYPFNAKDLWGVTLKQDVGYTLIHYTRKRKLIETGDTTSNQDAQPTMKQSEKKAKAKSSCSKNNTHDEQHKVDSCLADRSTVTDGTCEPVTKQDDIIEGTLRLSIQQDSITANETQSTPINQKRYHDHTQKKPRFKKEREEGMRPTKKTVYKQQNTAENVGRFLLQRQSTMVNETDKIKIKQETDGGELPYRHIRFGSNGEVKVDTSISIPIKFEPADEPKVSVQKIQKQETKKKAAINQTQQLTMGPISKKKLLRAIKSQKRREAWLKKQGKL